MESAKGTKLAKTTQGYRWAKPVEQFDMYTGKFIARYASGKEASRATGVSQSHISGCCNGKALSAGNYAWRFAEDVPDDQENPHV